MPDETAIRAAIRGRNALRREARLPLIDEEAEFRHAFRAAAWAEYRTACDLHATEREEVRATVLAELRALHGPGYGPGTGMGARYRISSLANARFRALITERYGLRPPQV